jgi:BTB/POZ domain-containing protein 3/6
VVSEVQCYSSDCPQADKSYTASVVLDGAELSYFGQEGLQEVVVGDSKATFQFQCSSESTNGTGVQVISAELYSILPSVHCTVPSVTPCVQGGQIPEIVFYGPSRSG